MTNNNDLLNQKVAVMQGQIGTNSEKISTKLDLVYFDEEIAMIFKMINEINNLKADKGSDPLVQSPAAVELLQRKETRRERAANQGSSISKE